MADKGVTCSMSRSGNVWDNAATKSFFSSLKTERIGKKVYRTRDDARADVCDYIERFYNTVRRHSTIGYLGPVEFERKVGLAYISGSRATPDNAQKTNVPTFRVSLRRTLALGTCGPCTVDRNPALSGRSLSGGNTCS